MYARLKIMAGFEMQQQLKQRFHEVLLVLSTLIPRG